MTAVTTSLPGNRLIASTAARDSDPSGSRTPGPLAISDLPACEASPPASSANNTATANLPRRPVTQVASLPTDGKYHIRTTLFGSTLLRVEWQTAPERADLTYAVRDLSVASVELHHELAARIGVAPQDLAALTHLSRDGPLTPLQLCDRLKLRKASVTSVVNRLQARGHANRKPHATDHRSTLVEVTDKGRRECVAPLAPVIEAISRVAAELTDEERRIAVDVLTRCTASIADCVQTPDR